MLYTCVRLMAPLSVITTNKTVTNTDWNPKKSDGNGTQRSRSIPKPFDMCFHSHESNKLFYLPYKARFYFTEIVMQNRAHYRWRSWNLLALNPMIAITSKRDKLIYINYLLLEGTWLLPCISTMQSQLLSVNFLETLNHCL